MTQAIQAHNNAVFLFLDGVSVVTHLGANDGFPFRVVVRRNDLGVAHPVQYICELKRVKNTRFGGIAFYCVVDSDPTPNGPADQGDAVAL